MNVSRTSPDNRDGDPGDRTVTAPPVPTDPRLAAFLSLSDDGFWEYPVLGEDHIWFSDRALSMLGIYRDDFPPSISAMRTLVHPDDLPLLIERIGNAPAGDTPITYTLRMRHHDGDFRHFQFRAMHLPGDEADNGGLVGTMRPVADRNLAKEVSPILDASGDLFLLINRDGIIHDCNPAVLSLLNIPPEGIPGAAFLDRLTPTEAADCRERLRIATESGKSLHFLHHIGERVFDITLHPLPEPNGEIQRFSVHGRDSSEVRHARSALADRERDLEMITDSVPAMLAFLDTDQCYRFVNRKYEEFFGQPRDSILGHTPQELLGKAVYERARPYIEKALSGEPCGYEGQFDMPQRPGCWLSVELAPDRGSDGAVRGFFVMSQDITVRKQAELAVQDRDEQLRAIYDHHFQLTGLLDPRGTLLSANRTALEFVGGDEAAIINRPFWETPWWAHSPETQQRLRKAIETAAAGDPVRMEVTHRNHENELRIIDFSLSPVHDDDGKVRYLVPEGRDITEQRRTEAALHRTTEVVSSTLRLYQKKSTLSIRQLTLASLEEAIRLSGSRVGMFTVVERSQSRPGLTAWSTPEREVFSFDTDPLPDGVRDDTPWLRAIPHGQAGIVNDASPASGAPVAPGEEVPVERFLTVPVLEGEVVKAVLLVGDKGDPYSDTDLQFVQLFAENIWRILREKRGEEERQWLFAGIEQSPESIVITDRRGRITYVNPAFERITGYGREEAIGNTPAILKSGEHPESFYREIWDTIRTGQVWEGRFTNRKKDGTLFHEEASIAPVIDEEGQAVAFVAVKRDISHELAVEAQLRHAQKMEAIGTLAGGIAHDFNNILCALLGYADMARETAAGDPETAAAINQVITAAERAEELVAQILTFSRQTEQEKKHLILQPLLRETVKLLRGTVPRTIEIVEGIEPGCGPILGDPSQIHQVVMNLCTNAFHAMRDAAARNGRTEREWRLEIRLKELELAEPVVPGDPDLPAGRYARISVSDTGDGIPAEIEDRIFDPYFTTKDPGEGTGLGLALVHSIVQSHQGGIVLDPEPGQGTTFHIFLPVDQSPPMESSVTADFPRSITGSERILLVDDEAPLREILQQSLERFGYSVHTFPGGSAALAAFQAAPDSFDLVVTDHNMPKMTGMELAAALLRDRPEIPIILCTGFSDNLTPESVRASGLRDFILKPVLARELAERIRLILDDPGGR